MMEIAVIDRCITINTAVVSGGRILIHHYPRLAVKHIHVPETPVITRRPFPDDSFVASGGGLDPKVNREIRCAEITDTSAKAGEIIHAIKAECLTNLARRKRRAVLLRAIVAALNIIRIAIARPPTYQACGRRDA